MKIKLIGLNWKDNQTPVKWESEDGKYELRLGASNKISESVLEDKKKELKLAARVDSAINENDKFECDIYRHNATGDAFIASITFDANRVTQIKSSLKSGSSLRSTGFSQNGTPSKKGVDIIGENNAGDLVATVNSATKWILVDAKTRSQAEGGVYWRNQLLKGSWPVPISFCDELVVKRNDGSPVSGSIHFIYDGIDQGILKFKEDGTFELVSKENGFLPPQYKLAIEFRKVFYREVKKSNVQSWKSTTSVSEICNSIYPNLQNIDGFKKYLNSNYLLNELGKDTFDEEIGVDIPIDNEKEAACLLYIHLLNEKSLNGTNVSSENQNPLRSTKFVGGATNQYAGSEIPLTRSGDKGWSSPDKNYFLAIVGSNSNTGINVGLDILYRLVQDRFVELRVSRGKITNPVCRITDDNGKGNFGTITFDSNGKVSKNNIQNPDDRMGRGAFYDSVKELFKKSGDKFYNEIVNCGGSVRKLSNNADIQKIISEARLKPGASYSDCAEAIQDFINESTANSGSQNSNLGLNNQTNQGNNTINNQVKGIFSREDGIWSGQKNGEKYVVSLDGKNSVRVFPALLYNLAEDKLLKLYDQRGSLASGTFDFEMGSNRGFIGSITFNNGVVASHDILHYASNSSVSEYEKIKNYSIRRNIDYKKEMIEYNGDVEKVYDMFSKRYGQDFNQKVLEFTRHNKYGWSAEEGYYYISANGGNSAISASITVLDKLIKDGFAKLYGSSKKLMEGICVFYGYGEVIFDKNGKVVSNTIKGLEEVDDDGEAAFYDSAKGLLRSGFGAQIIACNGSMSALIRNNKMISDIVRGASSDSYYEFVGRINSYLNVNNSQPNMEDDFQQQNQEDVQYDYQQSAKNNFQPDNFYQQSQQPGYQQQGTQSGYQNKNENFNPGILNFQYTSFDGWAAYNANGRYRISVNGQPMHECYNLMRKMITDGFARLYGPDGGIAGGTCQFVDSNGTILGYVVFSNNGKETNGNAYVFPGKSSDGGKVGFYNSAKELLGPRNFRNEIIACNGSMDVLSRNNYEISNIIKNLKPGDYNVFYKAIENYSSTGKIPQQESAEQSEVPELKEVGGKLVVKGTDFKGTVETIPDGKNIVVENPCIFMKMLHDRIVKISGARDQRISYSDYNFTLDSDGFLSKEEDNRDGGVMPFVNEEDAAKKYDSVKKYYDRMNMDFENSILEAGGNLQSLIDKIKLQDDKNDKKSEKYKLEDELENKFVNESLTALKDQAKQLGIWRDNKGSQVSPVDNFVECIVCDDDKRLQIQNLSDNEKKINAIKRLILRTKNDRAKYKKRSFVGKVLHHKEKNANVTSKKINSCFKNAAKYFVKCVASPSRFKCADLLSNFKPMSGKSKWAIWENGFEKVMTEDNLNRYTTKNNYKIDAAMGMLFVSMIGLGGAKNVICACDALKNGGINSKDKSGTLAEATQIRKAIKAKCSGGVDREDLKNYIRKLCVNDYKFITRAGFDEVVKYQKEQTVFRNKSYNTGWVSGVQKPQ